MRTTLTIACVLSVVLPTCKPLASLVTFEGEIEMSTSTGPATPTPGFSVLFEMKGDKVRTESKGVAGLGSFVSITDASAKKTWTVDNTARTYSEIDLSALKAPSSTPKTPPPKIVKTGRSDKVAGYACDVYEYEDTTSAAIRTEVCTASGLSMLALGLSSPFSAFAKSDDAWSAILEHGFPLRIALLDAKTGAPMMKMEATRIERKSVPDADLRVPPGYAKTASAFGIPTSTTTSGGGTF
jgi:hypothetical protein